MITYHLPAPPIFCARCSRSVSTTVQHTYSAVNCKPCARGVVFVQATNNWDQPLHLGSAFQTGRLVVNRSFRYSKCNLSCIQLTNNAPHTHTLVSSIATSERALIQPRVRISREGHSAFTMLFKCTM